jgi:molybdopterin converting factor small subunit
MTVNIIAFGIAKEIIGSNNLYLEVIESSTIADLKHSLIQQYPAFQRLASFAIAVNAEYREDNFTLGEKDEIVIIPPVSGG